MVEQLLAQGFIIGVLATSIRLTAPMLFAALGEMFAERASVLNLGVEGIMLMGAYFAFWASFTSGSPWLGLVAGMAIGGLMGLGMAFISVNLRANQGISGIGIYLLGWGLSGLFFRLTFGAISGVAGFQPMHIPILSAIPVLGPVLFQHNVLVYIALLLVPLSYVVLFKTTFGLSLRAVGENPEAADTMGIPVYLIQYVSVILGGILAGLAGAFLTVGQMNMFVDNITAGRGFIAIALVYFGRWSPYGILAGSFLFSIVDALQMWLQVIGLGVPYEVLVMQPYILTVLVLAMAVGRSGGPAALSKPYVRGGT
ncbi:MAG: ABC transporter permease [Chloroflexi bacterium]|nr:ABC transporter permease [Chloroflexota bacterium]MBI5955862.1 ABC transporter permease [Chloroflexota bacterium]